VAITIAVGLLVLNFTGGEKKIERRIARHYELSDPRFFNELGVLLGPAFLDGNRIKLLRNGDEIFSAMLKGIESAQTSITFESYIYWSGEIGQQFAQVLSKRAREGVKVHVLLDWVGSAKMDDALVDEMQASGVEVVKFHAPHWWNIGRMNNRTHRKILVIDGHLAFTG